MTKKSQLVTSGIILSLLAANLVIGFQYKKDINEYESKLDQQTVISKYRQNLIEDKSLEMDVLKQQLEEQQNEIHKLKKQLENAKKRNESPTISVSRGETARPKIHMVATAYISRCYGCIGITAGKIDVRNTIYHNDMRVIAVDPRVIPLHSIVKIYTKDGSFLAYAGDTGGKIKGYKIDLLVDVNNEQKAFNFGVQDVTVQILREGKG